MEIGFFPQEKYKCYHILKIYNLFRKGLIYLKTKSKKFYYLYFIIFLFTIFIFFLPVFSFALGDPAIVNKINSAFEKIRDWIIKIATPAAAVAVGTGVFMKKFSFGDEEKIRTGKKLIKGSLFSYGFILAIDLILSAIKSLIG